MGSLPVRLAGLGECPTRQKRSRKTSGDLSLEPDQRRPFLHDPEFLAFDPHPGIGPSPGLPHGDRETGVLERRDQFFGAVFVFEEGIDPHLEDRRAGDGLGGDDRASARRWAR